MMSPRLVTLVNKRTGHPFFLEVRKQAIKYLYGTGIYYEPGGEERRSYENKWIMEDYVILEGIRRELLIAYNAYQNKKHDHDQLRQKTEREYGWTARDWARNQMDNWDLKNPRPQPPEIPNNFTLEA